MPKLSFIVPQNWDGRKLDDFLRLEHRISGTTIKRAKQTELGLTMDGRHIRTVDAIAAGAVIEVIVDAAGRQYPPSGQAVEVLYIDSAAAVLDKPAGMPCHPSRGHPRDSLANAAASIEGLAGLPFRPMGRLDKDTTGAVVCARHAHAANFFSQNRPQKLYLAISPPPPGREGEIEAPIEREEAGNIRRHVSPSGQYALTRYKTLLSDGESALLAFRIATGRTHQIRVHMSHIGCPLAGDALYGGDCSLISRQALHCARAEFLRPEDGGRITVVSPLPEDMRAVLTSRFGEAELSAVLNNIGMLW